MEFVPFSNYLISLNKMHVLHLFMKGYLQQTNYQDHQKKFKTELTSSTPTKSINPELIGWLSSLKTINVKCLIVTDYH